MALRLRQIGLAAAAITCSIAPATAQIPAQCHSIPYYALIPYGACPLSAPTCSTSYGVCRYPPLLPRTGREGLVPERGANDYFAVRAGTPCQCQASNGAAVAGIIR